MNTYSLPASPRLLIEARLRPIQGSRFQPTGFPDLGAATYTAPAAAGGVETEMLLVESAQSMANRLERVCWDGPNNALVASLEGIPFVRVLRPDGSHLTSSIEEAHRINSPYILEASAKKVFGQLKADLAALDAAAVDMRAVARVVGRFDLNALLHGVFLAQSELAGGRIRVARALSSFVEAADVRVAASGGVKNDILSAQGGGEGKKAAEGYGNVPFHRDEYVAGSIVAYFNLDLSQLRSYGLPEPVTQLLFALALYKIRAVLTSGLRFRTACDLDVDGEPVVTRPAGFVLPSLAELEAALPGLVRAAAATGAFATPAVTEVVYASGKAG